MIETNFERLLFMVGVYIVGLVVGFLVGRYIPDE